ncbi:MAG: alternative ribosome rescue aminoacyl-tRNA hydrolase ArfB [Anaerolineae bacterium]|nr:alternative ribosome rescue aminoacyl-tRNA hydrolase ArfB [Anaerolineae bacterium]
MKIPITSGIELDESELHETFIRATGPGGQNVNKVATAVQLRFDVLHSPSLPESVRTRLMQLARRRINARGELVITAQRFRTQEQNRADARARLIALIQCAAQPIKPRRPTRPSRAAKERRLAEKKQRGQIKVWRGSVARDEW